MSDRCLFYSGLLFLTSPLIFLSADHERYSQITFPHQELLKSLIVAGSIFPSTAVGNRISLTLFEQRMGVNMDAAGILGRIVYWFLFLIFLVPAADALGLPAVSNILNQLLAYIPNVFVAILVLFLGPLWVSHHPLTAEQRRGVPQARFLCSDP